MSFFTSSNGEKIEAQTEVSSGGIQPIIPANTKLECHVIEAKWMPEDNYGNNDHVLIRLHVTEPGPYRDFVVNHKLHVKDDTDKKRDKALSFLASYDAKGKGLLMQADQAGKAFTDALLSRALVGIGLIATFDIWMREDQQTGEEKPGGNWVRAIAPLAKRTQAQNRQIEEKAKAVADQDDDYDDDITF